ncbi:DUF1800 domain-containing protein [Paracoccaceae bacterium Fryx2]|nr:DUF1800 domain-containing protein [Paracoccaceae bacterium Fryx2]
MTIDPSVIAAIRFGYGLPLPPGAAATPAAMLAALAGSDRAAAAHPGIALADVLPLMAKAEATRKLAQEGEPQMQAYRDAQQAVEGLAQGAMRVTLARALASPDGFRERLAQFWTDHFTAAPRSKRERALPSAMVNDAIRPHLAGRFADMLRAVTLHPAMLTYLDQVLSVGPTSRQGVRRKRGLNENLARELIELHTLGVGAPYSQDDVRQMAELLTGLGFDVSEGFVFRPNIVEPGAETVLGRSYDGEGVAPILTALDDLAVRPETASHIARKLVVHFVSDEPDPALVGRLAEVFSATGGDLLQVYGALLESPAAWVPPGGKARQPYDFLIASLRALGLGADEITGLAEGPFRRLIVQPMGGMGQPWQAPRGPDGWPERAEAWITPQGMAARISWAMEMPSRLVPDLPDPREFALTALGPLAGERLLWAVERSENIREGVGLVLASPDFNRR